MKIKIALYLEFYHFLGGILFRKIGTGLLSSYKNQMRMLERMGIPFIEGGWDDSCDILQINTPWLKSLRLIKKAHRAGKKVIIWSHVTVEDAMQVFRFMPLVAPLFKRYLKYAYDQADMIFCPSAYTKSLLINYGIAESKLVVQSNGVDLALYYPDADAREHGREKYGLGENLAVGTVALAIPRKGINTFLHLAREFPQNRFVWFGAIYSSFLAKSLPKNRPVNSEFTGFVDDINEAFNSLDIFVFPSFEENEGMVILEAAALGLPIIVRDIPVYQGWLENGVNCLKAKTDAEFAAALLRLLDDSALRARLGQNAKILAEKTSTENLMHKLRREYATLLGAAA